MTIEQKKQAIHQMSQQELENSLQDCEKAISKMVAIDTAILEELAILKAEINLRAQNGNC